jgi:hypothetical protein
LQAMQMDTDSFKPTLGSLAVARLRPRGPMRKPGDRRHDYLKCALASKPAAWPKSDDFDHAAGLAMPWTTLQVGQSA